MGLGAGSGGCLQDGAEDIGRGGEEKGGALSQGRLQRRVQDVIVMAVAVGIAVVALGAGVVGCLLQPHEHVHLGKEQRA